MVVKLLIQQSISVYQTVIDNKKYLKTPVQTSMGLFSQHQILIIYYGLNYVDTWPPDPYTITKLLPRSQKHTVTLDAFQCCSLTISFHWNKEAQTYSSMAVHLCTRQAPWRHGLARWVWKNSTGLYLNPSERVLDYLENWLCRRRLCPVSAPDLTNACLAA